MASKNQQATAFLIFSALADIQLNLYGHTRLLAHFDPDLYNKLKNLKASFERNTKKAYGLFTEEEQLIFFDMINIFEALLESAKDYRKFTELMNLIKAWQNNKITVINSTEELIATAKQKENDSLQIQGQS